MVRAATWGHDDIWDQASAEGHVWVQDPTVAGVCADVHGLYCHQGSHGCPGSDSPLVARLGSEGGADRATLI